MTTFRISFYESDLSSVGPKAKSEVVKGKAKALNPKARLRNSKRAEYKSERLDKADAKI
jgi:hypothetical protein